MGKFLLSLRFGLLSLAKSRVPKSSVPCKAGPMILFVDFESARPPDCIVNLDLRYASFGFFQLPCWTSVV